MSKKKFTSKSEAKMVTSLQKPEPVKKPIPELKSRFYGMIRYSSLPVTVTEIMIEGNKFYEYEGLKGVYFSSKLFV